MRNDSPDVRRDRKALLIAPLVPVSLLILFDGISRAVAYGPTAFLGALLLGFYVCIVMEIVVLVVAIPLMLTLRRHLHSLFLCVGLGGLIATVPWLLLAAIAPLPDSASIGGVSTVVDGSPTSQWYIEMATVAGYCFFFGAIGGGAFWWLRRRLPLDGAEDG